MVGKELMVVMFKEALVQADEHDAQTEERKGDFWGLPSCFKGVSIGPTYYSPGQNTG